MTYSDNYVWAKGKPLLIVGEIKSDELFDYRYYCRIYGYPSGTWLYEKDMEYFEDENLRFRPEYGYKEEYIGPHIEEED